MIKFFLKIKFLFLKVGNVWNLVPLVPSELSIIERCPYYGGALNERFDCIIVCQH